MSEEELQIEQKLGKNGAEWVHTYAATLIDNGLLADSDKSDSEIIRYAYDLAIEARLKWLWNNQPFVDSPENPF